MKALADVEAYRGPRDRWGPHSTGFKCARERASRASMPHTRDVRDRQPGQAARVSNDGFLRQRNQCLDSVGNGFWSCGSGYYKDAQPRQLGQGLV